MKNSEKLDIEKNTSMTSKKDTPSKRLALLCAKSAIDKKANHSLIFQVGNTGAFTDYFLITSGANEKQVQAIADEICRSAKELGLQPLTVEGYEQGRWILIDFTDVVVHIFQDFIREFYDLESLWSDAPRLAIPEEYYFADKGASPTESETESTRH